MAQATEKVVELPKMNVVNKQDKCILTDFKTF